MHLMDKLLAFTMLGAEWVLWLLLVLSVVSVAIMIERFTYFARRKVSFDDLAGDLRGYLEKRDVDGAVKKYGESDSVEIKVGLAGVKQAARGADAAAEAMQGARSRARGELEHNLVFLGTLGNNAPFIGLFGTVLGIIRAFRDLSLDSQGGGQVVMAGISEALVATAIGLLVALPAVVMFNYFNRRVKRALMTSDAIERVVLAELRAKSS